ncbi:MAG: pyridoxamine 5'-phosphate oxidase [Candidatus Sumerlaeia bacterium]|nr:pyridoxamine 5'-phosphate oxidase [Candidatus Sumerlaeia bacterium]
MPIPVMDDPMELFAQWWRQAEGANLKYPNAVALATAGADGAPAVRMVLVKGFDSSGFTFYTNLGSAKANSLAENPRAALCYYWEALGRQVRVRGGVEPVTAEEADAYFATRPRVSQLGAWASRQSEPLDSRTTLEARVRELDAQHAGGPVPRPPFWSGFRLVPGEIEFWQEGDFRLHDRVLYRRASPGDSWRRVLLNP